MGQPAKPGAGAMTKPARQWWLNFYPVAVHVFRSPDAAGTSAENHHRAGFVRPETVHVMEVKPEEEQTLL